MADELYIVTLKSFDFFKIILKRKKILGICGILGKEIISASPNTHMPLNHTTEVMACSISSRD